MRRRTFVRLTVALETWQVLLFAAPMPLEIRLLAAEHTAAPVVVADFDYSDSSEEVADQRAQHAARVRWYPTHGEAFARRDGAPPHHIGAQHEIGRASCRERESI